MKNFIFSNKGSAVTSFIIFISLLLFVFLPLFSTILERYVINVKVQEIKDSMDITNTATYNALSALNLGKNTIDFNSDEALLIYLDLLVRNLNLNSDLTPKSNSIADDKVNIDSLLLYNSGITTVCPNGCVIDRPTIHSQITVPVRPSLFSSMINGGQPWLFLVHVDSELPVDN